MVPCSLIRGGEGWETLNSPIEAASNEIVLLVLSSISTQIHIKHKITTLRTECHWRAAFNPLNLMTGISPPPPTKRFSCQEINMWHGISGGRRRRVGHEA